MSLEIKEIKFKSPEYEQELLLRQRILREPLGRILTSEDLSLDANSIHVGAFFDGQLIGCLMLVPISDSLFKMRQVAVDLDYQGQGVGQILVKFAEQLAVAKNIQSIELNARVTAVPFYLKLGYDLCGDVFEEVTIPHRKMIKKLQAKYTKG